MNAHYFGFSSQMHKNTTPFHFIIDTIYVLSNNFNHNTVLELRFTIVLHFTKRTTSPNLALVLSYNEAYVCKQHLYSWHFLTTTVTEQKLTLKS